MIPRHNNIDGRYCSCERVLAGDVLSGTSGREIHVQCGKEFDRWQDWPSFRDACDAEFASQNKPELPASNNVFIVVRAETRQITQIKRLSDAE